MIPIWYFMSIILYVCVCRTYVVEIPDGLVNDSIVLTVQLDIEQANSDSIPILVEGIYMYSVHNFTQSSSIYMQQRSHDKSCEACCVLYCLIVYWSYINVPFH